MAGRNQKSAADYFSHDADASSDEKIIYLESLFGNTGYAIYFKFLERMTRADGFKIEWNDIKKAIYASEFHISVTEIDRFISECCRKEIKAFVLEESMLFSPGLIKRMSPLIDKREYNRLKYEEKKNKEIKSLTISEDTNHISVTEMTQSKEKESKEKESKETPFIPHVAKSKISDFKNTASKIYDLYVSEINPGRRSKQRALKNIATWISRGRSETDLIFAFREYSKTMSNDQKYRKDPANFYGLTEDYSFDYLPANKPASESPEIKKIKGIEERKAEEIATFGHYDPHWDEVEAELKRKKNEAAPTES